MGKKSQFCKGTVLIIGLVIPHFDNKTYLLQIYILFSYLEIILVIVDLIINSYLCLRLLIIGISISPEKMVMFCLLSFFLFFFLSSKEAKIILVILAY